MGKQRRAKQNRREQRRRVPRVILLTGPHTLGAEVHIKRVLETERPVLFLREGIATRLDLLHAVDFYKNARRLVGHSNPEAALNARLKVMCDDLGILHDFAEAPYSDDVFEKMDERYRASKRADLEAHGHAQSGNLEQAITAVQRHLDIMRKLSEEREENMARTIKGKVQTAAGSVAVFVGNAHISLVKKLRESGMHVVLYHSNPLVPVSAAVPHRVGVNPSRKQLVKEVFGTLVGKVLSDKYGAGVVPTVVSSNLDLTALRRIPVSEIEEMITQGRGKSVVGFRAHLLNFLQRHKFTFPSNEQIALIEPSRAFQPFIKVKVFKPK